MSKRPARTVILSLAAAAAAAGLVLALSRPGPRPEAVEGLSGATPAAPEEGFEAMFYEQLSGDRVRCRLCFRNCLIPEGKTGYCRVRKNRGGKLYSLVYGRPSAVHIDPVEKEPQLHFLPGTEILCLGTVGCNFACRHCHNWHLSQSSPGDLEVHRLPPEEAVRLARERGVPTISFTYNDPIVCYEYVYDTARLAREQGVRILWHSNGSINPEPLKRLLKYTDAVTIDLKGFSERAYRNSDAELEPVLRTLKTIRESGVWLEIVNLVIPTINDDPEEIRRMCRWIVENLGPDVPLHFSRFFPNYRLNHLAPTPVSKLEEAGRIAREEGVEYITIGNLPGHELNSTFCPGCSERVIHRVHFQVLENRLEDGKCPSCAREIAGVWK